MPSNERLSDTAKLRHELQQVVAGKVALARVIKARRESFEASLAADLSKIQESETRATWLRTRIAELVQEGHDARKRDAEAEEKQRVLEYEFRKWKAAGLSDDAAWQQVKKDGVIS